MLAATATELASIFRSEVDDLLQDSCGDEDCLWKNSDVYTYMTEAVDAVMRGTGGVGGQIRVDYALGQAVIALPKKVLQVSAAWLADGQTLRVTSLADAGYDRNFEAYELDMTQTGTPGTLMTEYGYDKCAFYPLPDAAGTLTITGRFTLSMPLQEGVPLPIRDIADQRLALVYMKSMAYAKHDAETYDLGRSQAYRAEFDTRILDREVELRKLRRPPGTVKMNW